MTQTGRIIRVLDSKVWLIVGEPQENDRPTAPCCTVKPITIEAGNPDHIDLKVDDKVEIVTQIGPGARIAGTFLGVAVSLFLLVYYGLTVLFPLEKGALMILAWIVLISLGLVAAILYFLRKRSPLTLVVTAKVQE